MHKSSLFLLFMLSALFAAGQRKPFHLKVEREIPLAALGLGSEITGRYLISRVPPLDYYDWTSLSSGTLSGWDAAIADNWSPAANVLSHISVIAPAAAMGTYVLFKDMRSGGKKQLFASALVYAETILISDGITCIAKGTLSDPRPYAYNPDVPASEKETRDAHLTFFSSHTNFAATTSFYFATWFTSSRISPKAVPYVWAGAATLPALTGYLRMKAGRHFPRDVAAGYICGAVCGTLIPLWHTRRNENHNVSIYPAPNGVGLVWRW